MAARAKAKPKHRQVFEALRRDLQAGRYTPGQKFPSENVLVKRFHASRITIGRAVHDLQQSGLVERFAGSGTYVTQARETPRGGPLFGLIIPDLGHTEIFEPICQGIANAQSAQGHGLLWPHAASAGNNREQQALQLCDQCIQRQVSGVFFAPLEMSAGANRTNREVVSRLRNAGVPIVLLDREVEGEQCDVVSVDNERAGFLAAGHLQKLGARRVAFLAYRGQALSVAGRIAGYHRAIPGGPVFQVEAAEPLLLPDEAKDCDGFVCSSDHIAGHLMLALLAQGVAIPGDVRIAGIDDVDYASLLPVPLTTVHQPCGDIGEAALHALIERLARPKMPARRILLDCHLVIRKSCGAVTVTERPFTPSAT
jgi:GntR family transcriptional regulator of arabinose operon